jgi:hypothetical protein
MACVNLHRPSRGGIWTTCVCSDSSGCHAEFHEGCYQKHTNPLNCRTSSSDISGYHANFHEGHGAVGEWQGRGIAIAYLHGTARQGNGTGAASARHAICELALRVPIRPIICRTATCVHESLGTGTHSIRVNKFNFIASQTKLWRVIPEVLTKTELFHC